LSAQLGPQTEKKNDEKIKYSIELFCFFVVVLGGPLAWGGPGVLARVSDVVKASDIGAGERKTKKISTNLRIPTYFRGEISPKGKKVR